MRNYISDLFNLETKTKLKKNACQTTVINLVAQCVVNFSLFEPEGAFESLAKGGVDTLIIFPSFLGKIEAGSDS